MTSKLSGSCKSGGPKSEKSLNYVSTGTAFVNLKIEKRVKLLLNKKKELMTEAEEYGNDSLPRAASSSSNRFQDQKEDQSGAESPLFQGFVSGVKTVSEG